MLLGYLYREHGYLRAAMAGGSHRAIVLLPCLFGLSTAIAQPEPDMDGSGCVDLFDVALFQNRFGLVGIPGSQPCDFNIDGICNLLDYGNVVSVLRGRFAIAPSTQIAMMDIPARPTIATAVRAAIRLLA